MLFGFSGKGRKGKKKGGKGRFEAISRLKPPFVTPPFATAQLSGVALKNPYHSSKWHYRQSKIIFELILLFIADTDTDENKFGIHFSLRRQMPLFFAR